MANKDTYWFKHDYNAGRGLKIRKMQHIYGHEGKGMYWDVVEVLRSQEKYQFEADDSSLQMLSDLIGFKDDKRFITWFRDCVRFELFELTGKYFICPPLIENMKVWDKQKLNGSQGGRPKNKPNQKPNETQPVTQKKPVQYITEDNITEEESRLEEIREFYNNEQLKISIIKNLKSNGNLILDINELDTWFDKFLDKIIAERQLNQSNDDLASWFNNWIKKEFKPENSTVDADLKHFG